MEDTLKNRLASIRPKLSEIAPLTYAICWGYVVINCFMGLGLFFLYQTSLPLAVANIFSYQVWGVLFFLAGVVSGYSLIANKWKLTRALLMVGLVLKAVWAIALIIRCLVAPQTIIITLVWLFFAYIQAVTYIYFLPKNQPAKGFMQ